MRQLVWGQIQFQPLKATKVEQRWICWCKWCAKYCLLIGFPRHAWPQNATDPSSPI